MLNSGKLRLIHLVYQCYMFHACEISELIAIYLGEIFSIFPVTLLTNQRFGQHGPGSLMVLSMKLVCMCVSVCVHT